MPSWLRLVFSTRMAPEEELVASLHEQGCLGVETREDRVLAYFPPGIDPGRIAERLRASLEGRGGMPDLLATEQVPDGHWHEKWMSRLTPIPVGRRLLIVPGTTLANSGSRLLLRLSPGQAFGTGEHATTRMCLEALERTLTNGDALLDVGTGSGILAIAGWLLGAGRVTGLDTDATAIEVAARNAVHNGATSIEWIPGSLDSAAGVYDLVTANLDATALAREMREIATRTAREAILSGVLVPQEDEILSCAGSHDMRLVERVREGEWSMLRLKRADD